MRACCADGRPANGRYGFRNRTELSREDEDVLILNAYKESKTVRLTRHVAAGLSLRVATGHTRHQLLQPMHMALCGDRVAT
jgi:hypothetical protein